MRSDLSSFRIQRMCVRSSTTVESIPRGHLCYTCFDTCWEMTYFFKPCMRTRINLRLITEVQPPRIFERYANNPAAKTGNTFLLNDFTVRISPNMPMTARQHIRGGDTPYS